MNQDQIIIVATLSIGFLFCVIMALTDLKSIMKEETGIVILRIILLMYAGVSMYSLISFLEQISF